MKIDKNSIAWINQTSKKVLTLEGNDITSQLNPSIIETAISKGEIFFWLTDDGKWVRQGGVGENKRLSNTVVNQVISFMNGGQPVQPVTKSKVKKEVKPEVVQEQPKQEISQEVMNFKEFIHNAVEIRPKLLKMPDLKWKYLVRSVMKGKNIMMVGDAGAGKTFAVQQLTKALNANNKEVTKQVTKKELEALKKNLKVEIKSTKLIEK